MLPSDMYTFIFSCGLEFLVITWDDAGLIISTDLNMVCSFRLTANIHYYHNILSTNMGSIIDLESSR